MIALFTKCGRGWLFELRSMAPGAGAGAGDWRVASARWVLGKAATGRRLESTAGIVRGGRLDERRVPLHGSRPMAVGWQAAADWIDSDRENDGNAARLLHKGRSAWRAT